MIATVYAVRWNHSGSHLRFCLNCDLGPFAPTMKHGFCLDAADCMPSLFANNMPYSFIINLSTWGDGPHNEQMHPKPKFWDGVYSLGEGITKS